MSTRPLVPLAAAFAVFGTFWGAWAVVAADVRRDLDVSYGTFGLLLSAALGAAAVSNLVAGALAERWGTSPAIARFLTAWAALLVALVVTGTSSSSTAVLLVVLVAVGGAIDVVINVAGAAAFEGRPGRLVQLHGFFNGGEVVGALMSGAFVRAGASWRAAFVLIAVAAVAVAALVRRTTLPASEAGEASLGVAARALRRERLVGVALLFALAALVEGGIETWGVLFLRDGLGASVAVGAAGAVVAFGVVAAARFVLGPLAGSRGVVAGVAVGSALAGSGVVWLAFVRPAPLAAVGLVVGAAGASMCWPLLIAATAAGRARPAAAVGAVTSAAYAGFVVGPSVVGWVAGGFGLRTGLLSLVAAAAVVTMGALRLRVPVMPDPAAAHPPTHSRFSGLQAVENASVLEDRDPGVSER